MHYKIEIEKIENCSKFMDSENPVQSLAYSQIKTALGEPFLLVARKPFLNSLPTMQH